MDNVMEAYNWQLAQMWLDKIKDIIEPGKIYVTDNINGYGRYDTFGMLADYLIMKGHKAVLYSVPIIKLRMCITIYYKE